MIGPLILENKFKRTEVNAFFNQIGVSQEDMLKHIHIQLKDNPNRDTIENNINIFKKRERKK
jgi:hypothetical protein